MSAETQTGLSVLYVLMSYVIAIKEYLMHIIKETLVYIFFK